MTFDSRNMMFATLSNGVKMPMLGHGVYQVSQDDCERCVRDALEVLIDGRSNGTTLVTHGIGVDPQPADATQNAPKADFSENILKFGPVKHAGPVRKKHFTLSNAGGAELIVRAVEGEGHVATTLAPGQKIAPGDSLRCEILLDPRTQDYGIVTEHLVVVTNDPVRPMRRIRVTAIIEE